MNAQRMSRMAYFILPGEPGTIGRIQPCVAVEGGVIYRTDICFGGDLDVARVAVQKMNASIGITAEEAGKIVDSCIGAM